MKKNGNGEMKKKGWRGRIAISKVVVWDVLVAP